MESTRATYLFHSTATELNFFVSRSANRKNPARLQKEQPVCAVHRGWPSDVKENPNESRSHLRRMNFEEREGDERHSEGLIINIP